MGHFNFENLSTAIRAMQAMDADQQHQLDVRMAMNQHELFEALQSPLQHGASAADIAELMDILATVYLTMEQSGLPWPRISREVLDRAEKRVTAGIVFTHDLPDAYPEKTNFHWIDGHPERYLFSQIAQRISSYGYSGSPAGEVHFNLALFILVEALAIVGKTLPRSS